MWNKLRNFICSLFRRFQLLLGSLAVILLAVFLPLSVSADTIHIKPTFGTQESNFLNVANSFTNFLEKQYTYGGTYNPLILVCETAHSWVRAISAVRWNFGKTLPAGTEITIQCAGWHNKSYSLNEKSMYVALTSPTSQANWQTFLGERTVLPFNNDNYVQTSNGVYRGYLCTGKYVLPADTDYIYLVWDITLSGTRNGGAYVGISCSDISYDGNPLVDGSYPGFEGDTSTFTDYEQQESALMQDIDIPGALDNLNEHKAQSDSLMRQLLGSFQAISALFLKMSAKLPEFYILASVSFSIGIFCALVGIAQGIYRSHIRSVREKRRTINAQAREAAKFNIRVTKTKTVGDPETGVRTIFSRRVK